MRLMLTVALLVILLVVTAPFVFAEADDPTLNLDRVKRSIRMVENWDGRSVGGSGEVGPYQIMPHVWVQFSEKPISWAYGSHPAQKAEQERVAAAIVDWIAERLTTLRLPRTARSIGLVWTAGYGNVKDRKYGKAKRDYAQRVQNIYDDFKHTEEGAVRQ